jgi:hypothetical protein
MLIDIAQRNKFKQLWKYFFIASTGEFKNAALYIRY